MSKSSLQIRIKAVGTPGLGKTTAINLMTQALRERFDFEDTDVRHLHHEDRKKLTLRLKED